jgi:hypothetical protein
MARVFRYPLGRSIQELAQSVYDLWASYRQSDITVSGNHTTSGKPGIEYVYTDSTGTGTQTITLATAHGEGDEIVVKRNGTAPVTTATENSETIDGSSTATLASQYDSQRYRRLDNTQWVIL